jgi:hypothetical protein
MLKIKRRKQKFQCFSVSVFSLSPAREIALAREVFFTTSLGYFTGQLLAFPDRIGDRVERGLKPALGVLTGKSRLKIGAPNQLASFLAFQRFSVSAFGL